YRRCCLHRRACNWSRWDCSTLRFSFGWSALAEPRRASARSNWKATALSDRNTRRQKRNRTTSSPHVTAVPAHESVRQRAKPYGRGRPLTKFARRVSNPLNAIQVLRPDTRGVLRNYTRGVSIRTLSCSDRARFSLAFVTYRGFSSSTIAVHRLLCDRHRGHGHEPGTTPRVSNSLVWMRDRPLSRVGDESRSLLRGRERYAMRAPRASA